ncbi:dirigent protein 21-like [Rosa rugosa]|uniref:dirigent protein 21-like n=1 Tax=Rosa rugosa TaxID=74645 RepID=UPI002B40D234|nr:dirigent protein 21-like [Rosa rugosa]
MTKKSKTLPLLDSTSLISLTICFFTIHATAKSSIFSENTSPLTLGIKQEKLSHLHFYFHDIASGPNPTSIWVARAPTSSKSPTLFGSVAMIDDALTIGPKRSSKVVGRAQGFYASASQSENALMVTMNLAFTEGKFNGSSLTVVGRNPVVEAVREMPIIGGSGVFRFSRGYVQVKTLRFNATTGDAVVEYNVFVFHY